MTSDSDEPAKHGGSMESVDRVLEPLDLPKNLTRFRDVKGIVTGAILVSIGVIGCLVLLAATRRPAAPLIVLGLFGVPGTLRIIGSWTSYRQLTRAVKAPAPTYTQFQTSTATEFRRPLHLGSATTQPGETVGNWFGPVNTQGVHGISFQIVSREVDVQAINTLLFTDYQVIGLMLGPDDLQHLESGTLKRVANTFVEYSAEAGVKKGMQFATLNQGHWDEMVRALVAQPLDVSLQNHLNFGLPYGKLERVEVENHFVNPGFTFHLSDDSRVRYGSFRRNRLAEIAAYLKQYVKVE